MLPLKHSAVLLTCIKLYLVLKTCFVFLLSGHLRRVLLYIQMLHVFLVYEVNSPVSKITNYTSVNDQINTFYFEKICYKCTNVTCGPSLRL